MCLPNLFQLNEIHAEDFFVRLNNLFNKMYFSAINKFILPLYFRKNVLTFQFSNENRVPRENYHANN